MTTPYSQLTPDQLHSALSERDDQLRMVLVELKYVKEELEGRTSAMFKEREYVNELKSHLHQSHATALLENTEPPQLSPVGSKREPDQPATVGFLTTGEILPGLREAWRILNVAPEEDLAFKVGRLMDRIKELEG